MKKLLPFFIATLYVVFSFGQSQRLVLLEEFTSATCGPCVSKNSSFHSWQTANPDKFTSIYYHVNWPQPGDPMNLANPSENGARVDYYMPAVGRYVPYSVLDGNYYNGSAGGWSLTTVNARWTMPSPFSIQVKHQVSAGMDSVYSTMLVKCTEAINANLTAHNVIIEKWIHFNSAPCAYSNGERDFYWVMKKMLPGKDGTTIPSNMQVGDYVLLEGAWKFGTVYDPTQIAAVGFVQNKTTKEIYQAANSSADPLSLPYNTDVQVMEIQNVVPKTCNDHMSPWLKVRNNGNNAITSITVKYKVNDGSLSSFTWNGNLPSLGKTVIQLPEYQFDILTQNTLTVYTTAPNASTDEYPKNDTIYATLVPAPISTNEVKLVLRCDNNPQDITWDIKGSTGNVIANGGPYTTPNQVIQQTIPLNEADCHTFTIYDAGGNGICCSNGTGVYEISSGSTIIRQGGTFASFESSEFLKESPVSAGEHPMAGQLIVSPNPFDGNAKVTYYMEQPGNVTLSVYSAFGQVVKTIALGVKSAGSQEYLLDGTDLKAGIYILKINTGNRIQSRKISVVR